MTERATLVCRGSSVCSANGVCAQTQENVMESAVGNERALASSVTCTAEAPVALPVYVNFSFFCLSPLIPSILLSAFLCRFCLYLSHVSLYLASLSVFRLLSIPLSHSLSGLCTGKWNHGFINKTKGIHFEASALPMSSARNTKTVMYQSAWHSVRKYRRTGSSVEETQELPWIQMFSSLHRIEVNIIE